MTLVITGGPLFDGTRLYAQGSVLIENGRVSEIRHDPAMAGETGLPGHTIDTRGDLIMPGLVDLHSDSLERSIEKRKGVYFDVEFAILNLDRLLASCGITSFFHAISFADNELGLRSPAEAEKCVRQIKAFQDSGQALVRHKVHIRYEVGSEQSFRVIKTLLDQELVDLISIMDHTPGQGQFKSLAEYMEFNLAEYRVSRQEVLERAKNKQENNQRSWEMIAELARTMAAYGIPMLSHDDDTPSKIDLIHAMGIRASEFPVSMAAAQRAVQCGMSVFMGSPNLIRDCSTNGNLKASDAMRQGALTGLVSDYYPESLCQAAFTAACHLGGLEKGLGMATSGPGGFVNTPDGPGMLTPGGDADLIIVNQDHNWAHVTHAFVRGRQIFRVG